MHESFGCPVANSYGASEFLSLASECAEGSLHLNSDWAILESVDSNGAADWVHAAATDMTTNAMEAKRARGLPLPPSAISLA